jgi:hypothetical protein
VVVESQATTMEQHSSSPEQPLTSIAEDDAQSLATNRFN